MSELQCIHHPNLFCFVCAQYLYNKFAINNIDRAENFLKAYKAKFNLDATTRNVIWSPNKCCGKCYVGLTNSDREIKLSSPAIWNVPSNHPADCFFCNFELKLGARKNEPQTVTRETSVAMPVVNPNAAFFIVDDHEQSPEEWQSEEATVSPQVFNPDTLKVYESLEEVVPDELMDLDEPTFESSGAYMLRPRDQNVAGTSREVDLSSEFTHFTRTSISDWQEQQPEKKSHEPKPPVKLTQFVLNDIVRDLGLSKDAAQLLASRQVQLMKEFCPEISKGMFQTVLD